MALSEDMAVLLKDVDSYLIEAQTLFFSERSVLPAGAGPYIRLFETGGLIAFRTQNRVSTPAYERPSGQLVVHANKYPDARRKAKLYYDTIYAVRNRFVNGSWYRDLVPQQLPFDMGTDTDKRAKVGFNFIADKRPSVEGGGDSPMGYYIVEDFGGDVNGFVAPSSPDVYPVGGGYDTLVPGTFIAALGVTGVANVSDVFYLEANAKIDTPGARVKVAMFNMDTGGMIAGSELIFTPGQLLGERKRTSSFSIASNLRIGIKSTTDSTLASGAVWGIRLLHI